MSLAFIEGTVAHPRITPARPARIFLFILSHLPGYMRDILAVYIISNKGIILHIRTAGRKKLRTQLLSCSYGSPSIQHRHRIQNPGSSQLSRKGLRKNCAKQGYCEPQEPQQGAHIKPALLQGGRSCSRTGLQGIFPKGTVLFLDSWLLLDTES